MKAENMTNLSVQGQNSCPSSGQTGANGLSPLGRLPFVPHRLRTHGELRDAPGFFTAVVGELVDGAGSARAGQSAGLYPWEHLPLVIAVDRGRVLVNRTDPKTAPLPLNLAAHYGLHSQNWRSYADLDRHQSAHLLFAGVLATGTVEAPVLALTGSFETFLDLGPEPLNLQGFEQQEQSLADVLAAQTGGQWLNIRDYAAYGYEAGTEAFAWGEPLAAAASLTNWHSSNRFDPASGSPTYAIRAGWVRETEQGRELFPRTDPAVITAVTAYLEDEEQILLGQARAWGQGRFSTFAGFVEGGESLEAAVLREVWEENGGRVTALRYLGSQPWPFPRSLMCGYLATIDNPGQVRADGAEIETIRWFTRAELVTAHTTGEIQLPGRSSISRRLIEHWLGQALPEEETAPEN